MKPSRTLLARMLGLPLLCLVLGAPLGAMIFRPDKGSMWDPSVIWHEGRYYAFMMYDTEGDDAYCLLATSRDGVHWENEGTIVDEHARENGASFFKCFVAKIGDKFIMNHGVGRFQGGRQLPQDTMRFHQSKDLRHWEYITSTHPDPRWYRRDRWDHMYMLPKEEGRPEAGFWGYVVAVPKEGFDLPAMKQSVDGLSWEVLPPAKTEWGDTPPINHLEYGGCERIGGKYYLIGGTFRYMGSQGYSVFTLVSDGPRGPFRPDAEAYRLCGTTGKPLTWAAAWVRGNGELLVSNYTSMEHGKPAPWLLPLRKPIVDAAGHLRLGWWPGNEALKGERLALGRGEVALDGRGRSGRPGVVYLDRNFDLGQGVVIEGTIRARAAPGGPASARPAAGFVIEEQPRQAMALQLGIGSAGDRETHIGRLTDDAAGGAVFVSEDVTGQGCATVNGIDDGRTHTFRLLCRQRMFELYVDDLLVQTYVYQAGSGRLGFLADGSQAEFAELRAWAMSFPASAPGS
ncbi:MAG: hypothetical protein JNG83_07680 [Opitutaceae bacterium]|nr:hypothetical protein [Opitutaceae bacterium]